MRDYVRNDYVCTLAYYPVVMEIFLLSAVSVREAIGMCLYLHTPLVVGEDNFRFHTEFSQFIFRGFPACLDNTTNFAGFATVLSTICRGTTEDKSLWLFRVLDRKGMGTVSHADFVDAFVILISFIECVTGQEVGNSAELAKLRTDGIFDFLGKREEERVSSSELLNWIEGDEELKRHLDIFLSKV